jgi:hypothetical protein
MVGRWPLHPKPYANEALSSWINRLAAAYDIDPIAFLGFEFNYLIEREEFELIDLNPPYRLLEGLAERTNIEVSDIRALTAQSYVPLLIDSLAPMPGYYANYAYQFNLILSRKKPMDRNVEEWIPWFTIKRFLKTHGCKACIDEDKQAYIRLHWRFPWMMSCPKHGLLLKEVSLFSWPLDRKVQALWAEGAEQAQEAPETLVCMDAITLKAVTLGTTNVPARNMHGGVWLRMLRVLLEELSLPASLLPTQIRHLVESFWKEINLPFRYSLSRWRPFEEYKQESQYVLMHLASLIFKAACDRQSSLPDSLVKPFASIPISEKDLASFYAEPKTFPELGKVNDTPWGNFNLLVEKVIEEMRRNPEEVKRFRRMIFSFSGSEEARRRLDDDLRNLGIEVEKDF